MYALPEWATAALTQSHTVAARAWASVDGSPFGVPLQLVTGGSVKVDRTSAVQRTLGCTVVADVTDPAVDPLSVELLVEYGIQLGRDVQWVPQGVFVVIEAKEVRPGLVQLAANDRWQRILDARLERSVKTSGSTVAAIRTLVEGADYRLSMVDETGSLDTHPASVWTKDRAAAIKQLCDSIGAEVVMDRNGVPRLRPVPDLPGVSDPGDWGVRRGRGGAKVRSARTVTREGTYNAFVVSGEAVDGTAPVSAVAYDSDPGSATAWGGPFGKRPRFLTTPLVKTVAQAQRAADAMLAKTRGAAWSVDATALPHPGLDAGDAVRLEVAPGVFQTHMVDGYELPLGPGTVSLATRSRAEMPDEGA